MDESIKRYPQFNFDSIKNREAWFVYTLCEEEDRKNVLQALEGLEGQQRKEKAKEEIIKLMNARWPEGHISY